MTLDKLINLTSGDLVELKSGSTSIVGYFVHQRDEMVYLNSTWTRDGPGGDSGTTGYYASTMDVVVIKKREPIEDYSI